MPAASTAPPGYPGRGTARSRCPGHRGGDLEQGLRAFRPPRPALRVIKLLICTSTPGVRPRSGRSLRRSPRSGLSCCCWSQPRRPALLTMEGSTAGVVTGISRRSLGRSLTSTAAAIGGLTCWDAAGAGVQTWAQPPVDHVFVRTTRSKAAAAARIEAGQAVRTRVSCWGGCGRVSCGRRPWQHAGRYVSALVSECRSATGGRSPSRSGTARRPHPAAAQPGGWDTAAAMSQVRRFAVAGLDAGGAAGGGGGW